MGVLNCLIECQKRAQASVRLGHERGRKSTDKSTRQTIYAIHIPYPTENTLQITLQSSSPHFPIPIYPCEEVVLESENIPENTRCSRKDEVEWGRGVVSVCKEGIEEGLET